MKESVKIKRLLEIIPHEILYQFSGGSEDVDMFMKNMNEIAEGDGTTLLHAILKSSIDTLNTYEVNGDNRHVNYEMQFDDHETWIVERKEIKNFINKVKRYLR